MRRRLITSILVVVGLALGSAAIIAFGKTPEEEIPSGTETVEMEVEGMQTLMCEIGLKSALKHIEGVDAVTVDREAGLARVSYDPSTALPASFVQAANSLGFQASLPEGNAAEASSSDPTPKGHVSSTSHLTPEQVELVADFVARHIVEKQEIPEGSVIEEATGVELPIGDTPILQMAVMQKLAADPRGQKLLEGSRCSDYGACSMWGNLSGASGDVLAMYERERALDGTTYEDRDLPEFTALDLDGRSVSSRDLAGRPAVLALLSVHCAHSMETFPILQDLHRRLSPEGLQVVGVLVNSGTVKDANGWVPHFAPEHPMWVVEGVALGDLIGSHLVPTYLVVGADGKLREMLVGYQEETRVIAALESLEGRIS
jgi:copper chaperone CopZ